MHALVIDDSRAMRRIVGATLASAGFDVLEAGDGREALDVLEKRTAEGLDLPAVACIDWNMPVMDGLEFVTRTRATKEWRDVTLMMVTTESEQSQIVRALAAGAHEYLIKPFTPDALLDKLRWLGVLPDEVDA